MSSDYDWDGGSRDGVGARFGVLVAVVAATLLYWSLLKEDDVRQFLLTRLGDGDPWLRLPDEVDVAENMFRYMAQYGPGASSEADAPGGPTRDQMRNFSEQFMGMNALLSVERSFRGYTIRFYAVRVSPEEFGDLTEWQTWRDWFMDTRSPEALVKLGAICMCQVTISLGGLCLLATVLGASRRAWQLQQRVGFIWWCFLKLCGLAVLHEILLTVYLGAQWLHFHPGYWDLFSGNAVLGVIGLVLAVVSWLVFLVLSLAWSVFVRFVGVTVAEIAVLIPATVCLPVHAILCAVFAMIP